MASMWKYAEFFFQRSFAIFCFYFVLSFIYSVCSFVYPIALPSSLKLWDCFSFFLCVLLAFIHTMTILCHRCVVTLALVTVALNQFSSIFPPQSASIRFTLFEPKGSKHCINVYVWNSARPNETHGKNSFHNFYTSVIKTKAIKLNTMNTKPNCVEVNVLIYFDTQIHSLYSLSPPVFYICVVSKEEEQKTTIRFHSA